MRLPSFRMPTTEPWPTLAAALAPRHRQLTLTVCAAFVRELDPTMDLRSNDAGCPRSEAPTAAWDSLCQRHRWGRAHARRMLRLLTRGLTLLHQPTLARMLRPETNHMHITHLEAVHSHEHEFVLQDCLPRSVRRLTIQHPHRLFLTGVVSTDQHPQPERVAEEYVLHMQSVSEPARVCTMYVRAPGIR